MSDHRLATQPVLRNLSTVSYPRCAFFSSHRNDSSLSEATDCKYIYQTFSGQHFFLLPYLQIYSCITLSYDEAAERMTSSGAGFPVHFS